MPPPRVLAAGSVVDRYEILRHVADGGMGSVWLARIQGAHGFTKQVAMKTISQARTDVPEAQAMLLEEARISSKLSHANIAQLLDVGEYQGGAYLIFEWVEGKGLDEICRAHEARGKRVPLPLLLRALAEACAGLHAAHELTDEGGSLLNLVHRDVTPSNVLVSDKGFVKVIDFGIAKARDRFRISTRTGMVRGTPQYMSPEQACREPVDRRADVWSLGAVMYRGLVGHSPFPDPRAFAAFVEGGKTPVPPPGVPEDVQEICMRALRLEQKDRFQTADAMRAALERSLHRAKRAGAALPPGSSVISTEPFSKEQAEELASAETVAQAAATHRPEATVGSSTKLSARSDRRRASGSHLTRVLVGVAALIALAACALALFGR